MAELRSSHFIVTGLAKAPDVGVVVAAAKGQRLDVIRDDRGGHHAAFHADAAQWFSCEPAASLGLSGAPAKALSHAVLRHHVPSLTRSGDVSFTPGRAQRCMQLLDRTPKDMERRMAAHLHLAAITDSDTIMEMHHNLAMFYRELIQAAILGS